MEPMRRLVAVASPWFRQARLYLWAEQESGPLWRGRRRMSANLAMSDDLSRANAMDRPIVGPSLFPPTQSSPSQLRAANSQRW